MKPLLILNVLLLGLSAPCFGEDPPTRQTPQQRLRELQETRSRVQQNRQILAAMADDLRAGRGNARLLEFLTSPGSGRTSPLVAMSETAVAESLVATASRTDLTPEERQAMIRDAVTTWTRGRQRLIDACSFAIDVGDTILDGIDSEMVHIQEQIERERLEAKTALEQMGLRALFTAPAGGAAGQRPSGWFIPGKGDPRRIDRSGGSPAPGGRVRLPCRVVSVTRTGKGFSGGGADGTKYKSDQYTIGFEVENTTGEPVHFREHADARSYDLDGSIRKGRPVPPIGALGPGKTMTFHSHLIYAPQATGYRGFALLLQYGRTGSGRPVSYTALWQGGGRGADGP